jgi:hypothetical protein
VGREQGMGCAAGTGPGFRGGHQPCAALIVDRKREVRTSRTWKMRQNGREAVTKYETGRSTGIPILALRPDKAYSRLNQPPAAPIHESSARSSARSIGSRWARAGRTRSSRPRRARSIAQIPKWQSRAFSHRPALAQARA